MSAEDPVARFRRDLEQARDSEPFDATACVLATADAEGRPSARVVLLKEADDTGFVFYTNFGSRKARELEDNPHAALCFHWSSIGEQVRIEGDVERLSDEEADAYFASRARGSQIGAWASRQSEPVASREMLDAAYADMERRFGGQAIPRPPFWGGYRIRPLRIEIWHNRDHRMHDRVAYAREHVSEPWSVTRLYP